MPLARGQKIVFGCLAVFGTVVVMVIIAGALFVHWIKTPGVPLQGSRLLDSGTAVYSELSLRAEDPGVRELTRGILTTSRKPAFVSGPGVPDAVSAILGNVPKRDASDAEVDKILPIVVVMRRQEGKGGVAEAPLLAISFSRAGNSVRLVHTIFNWTAWRGSKMSKEEYAGEDLFRLKPEVNGKNAPVWVSFLGTDVLAAREPEAVKSAIDSMKASVAAEAPGAPSGAENALLADRPKNAFLYIAARPGYAEAALDTLKTVARPIVDVIKPLVHGGEGLSVWAVVKSADLIEGEILVKPAAAGGAGDRVSNDSQWSGKTTLMVGTRAVDVTLDPLPPRPGVKSGWSVRVTGLQSAVHVEIDTHDDPNDSKEPPAH